jgi:ribonuclease Z
MRVVLLGTAGYHPNDHRQTACMLLPNEGIALDAGTGFYRVGQYLKTRELDVFLTHGHLDHTIGLTYLFDVTYQHPLDRVVVYGEAEKLAAVERHLFAKELFPLRPPLELRPLEPEVELPGDGRLTWFPLEHPGGTLGFRLDWPGHSLAYVTDTTARPDAPYVERIRGVDLLLHECNFPDAWAQWAGKTGHSSTTPVVQVARRAEVGRLVLVHINPLSPGLEADELAAARAVFPHVMVGEDRMELEF